jgi:hypothetical protein
VKQRRVSPARIGTGVDEQQRSLVERRRAEDGRTNVRIDCHRDESAVSGGGNDRFRGSCQRLRPRYRGNDPAGVTVASVIECFDERGVVGIIIESQHAVHAMQSGRRSKSLGKTIGGS